MLVLNKKLGASAQIMFTKWISSWKVVIPPALLGFGYLLLIPNPSLLSNIVFAFVQGLVICIEFLFFPDLVGDEYNNTLYPKLLSVKNRITKNNSI